MLEVAWSLIWITHPLDVASYLHFFFPNVIKKEITFKSI